MVPTPRQDQYRLLGMTRRRPTTAWRCASTRVPCRGRTSRRRASWSRCAPRDGRGPVLNYLQVALAIAFRSRCGTSADFDRAVKYQRADGRKWVRVTVRNEAETTALTSSHAPRGTQALGNTRRSGGGGRRDLVRSAHPDPAVRRPRLTSGSSRTWTPWSPCRTRTRRRSGGCCSRRTPGRPNIVTIQSSSPRRRAPRRGRLRTTCSSGSHLGLGGVRLGGRGGIRYEFRPSVSNARNCASPRRPRRSGSAFVLFLPQRDAAGSGSTNRKLRAGPRRRGAVRRARVTR